MIGVVIDTKGTVYRTELSKPLHRSAGAIVDGGIEIVRPRGLKPPYCFIASDTGRLDGLPINLVGSWLYHTFEHGTPICGNIIIMKEVGTDLVGLEGNELKAIIAEMRRISRLFTEEEHNGYQE